MMKKILITLVCATLMLITPFTVVAHENKITSTLIEESNVDRIVAQIKTRIDEKLEKYESKSNLTNLMEIILYLSDVNLDRIVQLVLTIILSFILSFLIPLTIITFILGFIWGLIMIIIGG
jgi:methionine-rich copper-binding protein CopC